MDRQGVAGSDPVTLAVRVSVSRALVSPQGRDAVADAIKPLQNAFNVVVRHILGQKAKMIGDFGPQRSKKRDSLLAQVILTHAFENSAGSCDGRTGIAFD